MASQKEPIQKCGHEAAAIEVAIGTSPPVFIEQIK